MQKNIRRVVKRQYGKIEADKRLGSKTAALDLFNGGNFGHALLLGAYSKNAFLPALKE